MAITAYVPSMDEPAKRPRSSSPRALFSSARSIALLGFGTVGRSVAEILCRHPRPDLHLTHIFNRNVSRKRAAWVPEGVQWTEDFHEVLRSNANLVVELIGGLEPAHEFIRQALLSGKSVVTANKQVIAKHGPELLDLARQTGQRLEFGASVAGGVPVLPALQHGLRGDRLFRVCGILNGTCNYILSNMEANGTTLADALAAAQKLGYAESEPSDDIHGLDAACKLAILVRLGFQAELNGFDVPRQSITGVQPADFRFARQLGCTIRQVSFAELKGNSLQAEVAPILVPLTSPLASAVDNQNAIIFTGEKSGDTLLAGRGAGGDATAVAVVSDLLAIAQSGHSAGTHSVLGRYTAELPTRRHYLRVPLKKTGHMIEALMRVLDDAGIRVERLLTPMGRKTSHAAFELGQCNALHLEKVANQMMKQDFVSQRPVCLPVLN